MGAPILASLTSTTYGTRVDTQGASYSAGCRREHSPGVLGPRDCRLGDVCFFGKSLLGKTLLFSQARYPLAVHDHVHYLSPLSTYYVPEHHNAHGLKHVFCRLSCGGKRSGS
jgi:hypothetical protein